MKLRVAIKSLHFLHCHIPHDAVDTQYWGQHSYLCFDTLCHSNWLLTSFLILFRPHLFSLPSKKRFDISSCNLRPQIALNSRGAGCSVHAGHQSCSAPEFHPLVGVQSSGKQWTCRSTSGFDKHDAWLKFVGKSSVYCSSATLLCCVRSSVD